MSVPSGLLNEQESRLRSQARSAIEDLRAELSAFGATREDLDGLRQAARDLEELFLLVVVGEFNAGKSALINALLGADLLEEGVTPTTTCINVLRPGEDGSRRWLGEDILEREYDAPLLQEVAIVDTPGTNAVLRRHQQLTEQFIPRSDLVLFVTSADRPFTESERAFLETIRLWGKKVVLVINKIDLLRSEEERQQVVSFVAENVQSLLGFRPQIFPLSARRAREADSLSPWERVGVRAGEPAGAPVPAADPDFARLLRFIDESLTAENRVKLKLSSPLGVASRMVEKYYSVALNRLDLLAEDARTGDSLESQLDFYRSDVRAQLVPRLHQVENIIYELSQRGDRFFDETFRLGRVFDLVNVDKVRADFDHQVVANTAERIDGSVDDIAHWVIDREIRLWQGVSEGLSRRRQVRQGEMALGEVGNNFNSSRRELIQNVAQAARKVVGGFDREVEARTLGHTMREAVAQMALAEVGAVGLGTLVTVLIGTAAADVSGILAGTLLAGLGLYIIPARKQRVQKQFRQRTEELRRKLRDSLEHQLNAELDASVERIQAAIAPYLHFVRSEQEKVSRFHDRLVTLGEEMGALRRQIGAPSFEG